MTHRLIRFGVPALILVAVALAGIAFGFYYQAEIAVWINSLVSAEPTVPPNQSPATIPSDQSTLTLATLPEPLPLIYSETLDEPTIQNYLQQGAVILPLGRTFGEPGNTVVTAHSSGSTAFGPYRFAFSKLSEVKEGDEFTIHTPDATYTYRAYAQEIVWPHQVDRLPNDERSTVTLVTCWPLWTNFKRLLVHGELIRVDQPAEAASAS